ncbi:antibiotic biosynthesis monooxygenase [Vibrio sp. Isolate25]|uniref:putative quinol monooxygenase n=1 Tax=Vibrio sp. Isolate25 TaxID=2908535 RepID=UPI001EFCD83C|nr:antibiotic biosynthesis monooxygenase [Vibrio sp. Isolate25]MCG9595776.1 antibiotic biosynthesis monooxygenase [Vibrio sp. Isolate25]
MSILVQFKLNHSLKNTQSIKDFFTAILPDTRTFAGNLSAHLYEKVQGQHELVLLEEWQTPQHFDKYISWRKEIGDFDQLGTMLTDTPTISMLSKEV